MEGLPELMARNTTLRAMDAVGAMARATDDAAKRRTRADIRVKWRGELSRELIHAVHAVRRDHPGDVTLVAQSRFRDRFALVKSDR